MTHEHEIGSVARDMRSQDGHALGQGAADGVLRSRDEATGQGSTGAAQGGRESGVGASKPRVIRDVLAVDPGTMESGWVLIRDGRIAYAAVSSNERMLEIIASNAADVLAIEKIESYGMPVGAEIFETVFWSGRFAQVWRDPKAVRRVPRKTVKLHLCGSQRAKDANIKQALIDRIGPQGSKKAPGPTFGVKSHAWAALAVAVTVLDGAA